MTDKRLKAMQTGRKAAALAREREGRARVKTFQRWLAAGSPKGNMPEIPTDADYRSMKGAR